METTWKDLAEWALLAGEWGLLAANAALTLWQGARARKAVAQ